jgi:hypothetical protein
MAAGEVPELEELLDLLEAPLRFGPVRWALDRFEMGCAQERDTDALSDHLLALRALVDGGDDIGQASLPLRVAALCAEEPDRRAVQRRVESAFALERFVIRGGAGEPYVEAIGSESPGDLVGEVEDHVRGLLRDVLCGYLDADLAGAADEILLRSAEPIEIHAWDLRDDREDHPAEPGSHSAAEPPSDFDAPWELESEPGPPASDRVAPSQAASGDPQPPPEPPAASSPPGSSWVATAGLTTASRSSPPPPSRQPAPATDPDYDEDPGSYSAPV